MTLFSNDAEMNFASSMAFDTLQTPSRDLARSWLARIELWLEAERDQLPLWLPVVLGAGIGAWFVLPHREQWIGFQLGGLALALAGAVLGLQKRLGRAAALAGLLMALGCGLVWMRADWLDHQVLTQPAIADVRGLILRAEDRAAENKFRLLVETEGDVLPDRVRVSVPEDQRSASLVAGARLEFRARLAPPPDAALPGGYEFVRTAWFMQLGAVGQIQGEVKVLAAGPEGGGLRDRISTHVKRKLSGSAGGIAAAFASGDRGGIAPKDEEAMRASGLTHLLSISGLHVTAVVAAAMFLALRLLAFLPWLALRIPLLAISAGFGAAAGIGYTLLTGAEVPTIRSCVAALLVLLGIAIGREALTLRLVATGAIAILLVWPEALVGPSFQLSFTAIASIVALHEWRWAKEFLARREEGWLRRAERSLFGLLLTGLVVEVALAPIALFHFHKSGVFGALANMVAIPLTTFVIMPLEALALLFDIAGLGRPFWWLTGQALELLLWLAREVAAWPGAVAIIPSMSNMAFGLILGGGMWLMLWSTRMRLAGLLPIGAALVMALGEPSPDILVTDDGRHMAIRQGNGEMALLRERTGDFVRDVLAERAGVAEVDQLIENLWNADCSRDLCVARIEKGGRQWAVGATRSAFLVPWREMVATCAKLDIIVSERRLPRACKPRWLKVDRAMLAQTGGLAIKLGAVPEVETTRGGRDDHPWKINMSAPR